MTFCNRIFSPLLCAALAFPVSVAAQSSEREEDCRVRFTQDSATIALLAANIGPGHQAFGEEIVSITAAAERDNSAPCRVDLRLSRLTSDPSFPNYRFTVLGRPLQPAISETVTGAQNEIIATIPSSRGGLSVNLQANAPADWGTRWGRYNEQLQLSLVGASGDILDRLALNLELQIPKAVDVMFVGATGTGRTKQIDLGVLSATEATRSQPFGLRVWSSSGYKVDIASENSGTLAHLQGMDAIPYRLEIDGSDMALTAGAAVFSKANHTSRTGDLYRLGVSVPARRSVAGDYQDRITVSVSSI